jgi:hypothetical protein
MEEDVVLDLRGPDQIPCQEKGKLAVKKIGKSCTLLMRQE